MDLSYEKCPYFKNYTNINDNITIDSQYCLYGVPLINYKKYYTFSNDTELNKGLHLGLFIANIVLILIIGIRFELPLIKLCINKCKKKCRKRKNIVTDELPLNNPKSASSFLSTESEYDTINGSNNNGLNNDNHILNENKSDDMDLKNDNGTLNINRLPLKPDTSADIYNNVDESNNTIELMTKKINKNNINNNGSNNINGHKTQVRHRHADSIQFYKELFKPDWKNSLLLNKNNNNNNDKLFRLISPSKNNINSDNNDDNPLIRVDVSELPTKKHENNTIKQHKHFMTPMHESMNLETLEIKQNPQFAMATHKTLEMFNDKSSINANGIENNFLRNDDELTKEFAKLKDPDEGYNSITGSSRFISSIMKVPSVANMIDRSREFLESDIKDEIQAKKRYRYIIYIPILIVSIIGYVSISRNDWRILIYVYPFIQIILGLVLWFYIDIITASCGGSHVIQECLEVQISANSYYYRCIYCGDCCHIERKCDSYNCCQRCQKKCCKTCWHDTGYKLHKCHLILMKILIIVVAPLILLIIAMISQVWKAQEWLRTHTLQEVWDSITKNPDDSMCLYNIL